MTDPAKIYITVCTRNRPRMLARLLESFVALNKPDNVKIGFIVVENDTQSSVQALVSEISDRSPYEVVYQHEPRLGIPVARNRCMDIAREKHATHIAFVDDDETLPVDWLSNIWAYYSTQKPDSVIQGPVIPEFSAHTPEHLKPFFGTKPQLTGTRLHMCATNNVLVPMATLLQHNLRFDESRPLAGGTDSKLFRRAKALGVELIFCAEAPVKEEIPPDRTTFRWLSKRYFRVGLTIGEHREFDSPTKRLSYIVIKLRDMLWRLLKSGFYWLRGNKPKYIKTWLKVCRSSGELLGPAGVKVDSYKTTEGS